MGNFSSCLGFALPFNVVWQTDKYKRTHVAHLQDNTHKGRKGQKEWKKRRRIRSDEKTTEKWLRIKKSHHYGTSSHLDLTFAGANSLHRHATLYRDFPGSWPCLRLFSAVICYIFCCFPLCHHSSMHANRTMYCDINCSIHRTVRPTCLATCRFLIHRKSTIRVCSPHFCHASAIMSSLHIHMNYVEWPM